MALTHTTTKPKLDIGVRGKIVCACTRSEKSAIEYEYGPIVIFSELQEVSNAHKHANSAHSRACMRANIGFIIHEIPYERECVAVCECVCVCVLCNGILDVYLSAGVFNQQGGLKTISVHFNHRNGLIYQSLHQAGVIPFTSLLVGSNFQQRNAFTRKHWNDS